MMPERRAHYAFFGTSALLFAIAIAITIVWCASMSAMGEIPMPGGRTMSLPWAPMCGESWLGAAASFLLMWIAMMVVMMLPPLVPMLWRYRRVVATTGEAHLGRLTVLVGMGYFSVWTAIGIAVFAFGAADIQLPVPAHLVPLEFGVIVLMAGAFQFTAWKAHCLAYCRQAPERGHIVPADAGTAWRHDAVRGAPNIGELDLGHP